MILDTHEGTRWFLSMYLHKIKTQQSSQWYTGNTYMQVKRFLLRDTYWMVKKQTKKTCHFTLYSICLFTVYTACSNIQWLNVLHILCCRLK